MLDTTSKNSLFMISIPIFLLILAISPIVDNSRPKSAEVIASKSMEKVRKNSFDLGLKLDLLYLTSSRNKFLLYPIDELNPGEFLGAQMIAQTADSLRSRPEKWHQGIEMFRNCAVDENVRKNLRNLCLAQYRRYCEISGSCG